MNMKYKSHWTLSMLLGFAVSGAAIAQEQEQTAETPPMSAEQAAQIGWTPAASAQLSSAAQNQAQPQQDQSQTPQSTQPIQFPQAPGAAQAMAQQQQYQGQGRQPQGAQYQGQGSYQNYNGVTDLAPLPPPSQLDDAREMISPLSPDDIRELRGYYEQTRRASVERPVDGIGGIRSTSLDLSPGSSIPELKTMPNELSTMTFVDSTGAPWPLAAAPRVSNELFDVNWLQGTNMVSVSPLTSYNSGTVSVVLDGMPIPITVKLSAIDPRDESSVHHFDARHDFRAPGRGPNAQSPTTAHDQIALYDDTIQNFLDGLPPAGATTLEFSPSNLPVTAWSFDGSLFLRTSLPLRSSFQRTLSSADGTSIYQLPLTPFVALSSDGRTVTLQLDL